MKTLKNLFLACCIFGSIGTAKAQYQIEGDIEYNAMITDSRNSSHCSTDFVSSKYVVISTSFVGDSIKVVDINGFLIYAEENSGGLAN